MKYPEPQQMLGLRAMGKKGLDAYEEVKKDHQMLNVKSLTLRLSDQEML